MPWMRIEDKSSAQEERSPHSFPGGLDFAVIVISVAGVLAMVATWFLAAYFAIPDDNTVYLGLLGFLFVLFVTFPLAVSQFLQGQGLAAFKASLSFLLLGLIAAVAVGSLPLLWRQLIAAMPWVREIPWSLFLVLWLVAHDLWGRRKPTEGDHRHSWKGLIFLGSLLILFIPSTLFSAASRFSGGKAWLGALYLAIALLLGLLAISVVVEACRIWRRRREKPRESIT